MAVGRIYSVFNMYHTIKQLLKNIDGRLFYFHRILKMVK